MLIGNLTRDPELRTVSSGTPVCDLGLAINRSWTDPEGKKQEEVTFVDITYWGRVAENAAKYLAKGRSVFVEGRLQFDTWQDAQSGEKRSKLKVIGERLQFLGGGTTSDHPAEEAPQRGRQPSRRAA